MRTHSTPACGMTPHPAVNLACVRAPRRVRRQETGVIGDRRQEPFPILVCGFSGSDQIQGTATYPAVLGLEIRR